MSSRAGRAAAAASALQPSIEWEAALNALIGTDRRDYPARPEHIRARSTMQIFVERPSVRRRKGSDRWRNSGGVKGGTDYWIHDTLGLRKKYGTVLRESTERPPLRYMQYSLLRRAAGAGGQVMQDSAALLWTVEGTEDEPELPAQALPVPDTFSSADSLALNFELAGEELTGVLHGMPRKLLPRARAGTRSLAAIKTERRGEAAGRIHSSGRATVIDVEAALSANPHLFSIRAAGSPSQMVAGNPLARAATVPDESDPNNWWSVSSDWSTSDNSSDDNGAGDSDGSTPVLPSAEGAMGFMVDYDDVSGFDQLGFAEWDGGELWDDYSSTSGSSTPTLSESEPDGPRDWRKGSGSSDRPSSDRPSSPDLCDVSLETWEDQSSVSNEQEHPASWRGADEEPSLLEDGTGRLGGAESAADDLKRKLPQLESLQNATSKKGRVGPKSAFAAGFGLCMIFIGRLWDSAPSGTPSDAASTSMCDEGPVKITGALANSLCFAAPEGSNCPYECSIGFHQEGLHTCTRTPSGSVSYSGGACVPDHVCAQRVYLQDEGNLSLAVDEPSRLCTWDLVCTNETLSPVLRFSSFSLVHGNLSIHSGLGSEADYDNAHHRRLGQRRRSQLPPNDEMVLHGTDPWWISQPITVGPQSTAHVVYIADLPGQDLFTVSFSCGSFVEQCTLTDELELDWTTLQHPERPAVALPAWLSVPPGLAEPMSGW